MSKRTMIIVGVAVLALTVAGVTMASPMGMGMMGGGRGMGGPGMAGPMAIQAQQLTDAQQAEWKALQDKNFQLKKERIQLMVKTGYLTQEQADAKLQTMQSAHSFRMKNNLVAPGARLNAPLTDEQKADLKKMAQQRLAIQKENLSRLVSAGQITQSQADAKIEWMQKRIDASFEKGFAEHGGPGMGGGKGPGQGPRF